MTLILSTIAELRAQNAQWRSRGESIALVPTMGALHQGHLELVRQAKAEAARVIVSIFVNPTQFSAHEDLSKYPRPFEADLGHLRATEVDAVFTPSVVEMYGVGFCTTIQLEGPAKVGLEDRFRPDHFTGVATVVAKLLLQSKPDCAVFGEKDYQQLAVIRQMVKDLDIGADIVGVPTLRETDGLAMSSRNIYLSAQERQIAPEIYQTLLSCSQNLQEKSPNHALAKARTHLETAGFKLDYLELRDASTLRQVSDPSQPARLLFAGRLGTTRLIDNIKV